MKNVIIGIILLGICCVGCHEAHKDEEHHHEHGEQLTAYNAQYELFAEVGNLVVGEECDVLAHITRLSDFKPLDSVKVTMILQVGNHRQSVALNAPAQAGKYAFEVTPEEAGCGSLLFEIAFADSVSRIGFGHVHVLQDAAHEHEHEHEHEHGRVPAGAITFTKEQSWKMDFATEECHFQNFGSVITTTARIEPSQGDERQAVAKASGVVVFDNPLLVEGSEVRAGQRLFTIESSGLADNNMGVRFQEAAAHYRNALSEYERKQSLAADKIVSQADLERSRRDYETAKATYDNLKSNFSQKGATVSAPISGYVKRIGVRNGGYVDAGQTVVTIVQNRDLMVRAEVSPRYYAQLQKIRDAKIALPNGGRCYSIADLGGGLVSYGKGTDDANPLLPVIFRFRNTVDVVPGTFVTLHICTASDDSVLTVANGGLVEEMGNYFVFVQINPELFEKRMVQIGSSDGVRTVVTAGLKDGERVVSRGATMVKLAQGAGALDPHAGHVH